MKTLLLAVAALAAAALAPLAGSAVAADVPMSRGQIQMSFAPVAKAAAPAVVNVFTRKVVRSQASPLFNDPFFRRFFGEGTGMPKDRVQQSLGSGVIVDGKGVIVTNHHVVAGADDITVVLNDRREFSAELVGSDQRTDLAVLRIDTGGQTLPTLPLGDSDALEVGDLVLAIGNPFGVGQTVTSGIVSALARTHVGISDFQSFIQTDAAINPGNSGGALIDMAGRLVGINTAIYSRDGGSVGIGFAIPTSMVQAVLSGITRGGKIVRPWLGASGQAVTADMATGLQLPRPIGVVVNNVFPGSPAERGGLKVGDVITAVNSRDIPDDTGLRFRLATLSVGEEADLTVQRHGREVHLRVALKAPPEEPPRQVTEISGRNPFTGTTVANLNPALAEEMGIGQSLQGVVVTSLKRGSIAQRLNFRPGDIILKVNDRGIARVDDLRRIIDRGEPGWRITLNREGETLTFTVER
jgi:serine protease Do